MDMCFTTQMQQMLCNMILLLSSLVLPGLQSLENKHEKAHKEFTTAITIQLQIDLGHRSLVQLSINLHACYLFYSVGSTARCQQHSASTSGGTTNTSGINLRPCVHRRRSTSVEVYRSPPLNLQIILFLQKKTYIVSFLALIFVMTTWILTVLRALVIVYTV